MLILICGLPNAGKTTYSAQYENVIHLDDLSFKEGQFRECNYIACSKKGDVCVEGVYNSVKCRKELLEVCKDKFPKVCIWIDTSLEECIQRELSYRKRDLGIVTIHYDRFEPPTLEEGWDEIIVIDEDGLETIYRK